MNQRFVPFPGPEHVIEQSKHAVDLDEKGESLFCYVNGQFTTKALGGGFGRPSVFHIHIPASERAS